MSFLERLRTQLGREKPKNPEQVLKAANVREKLISMRQLIPDQNEEVYQFADHLTTFIIEGKVTPQNFFHAVSSARLSLVQLNRMKAVTFSPLAGRNYLELLTLTYRDFGPNVITLFGQEFYDQYVIYEIQQTEEALGLMNQ